MFKSLVSRKLSIIALTALASFLPINSAKSVTFQETEVPQEEFIAVAQPYGEDKYNLIVIEQIPGKNQCWNETGANPVNVDLLLLNFDFSGHCRRSTDANGYSIRYDSQDYGLEYILSLVEKDGNLLLMGLNRRSPGQPPVVIGSAKGISESPMKIILNPGWRFTKRTYEGKILGHVYFSYNSASAPQDVVPNMLEEQNQNSDQNNIESILEPNTIESTTEPISEEEILQQGTIQEIVAPEAEPRKEIDKSGKYHRIEDNSNNSTKIDRIDGEESSSNRYNLGQTRFQRMRNY
ncbi:DUF3747 domain-containing protein [Cyanobacterium aponinum UTEX 3222]|uniref:DUF3747 domain-containing protein n=3 Tax=Cyanobacterium aponinum TaxID=379064 RepID=K9Z617_CYAAP|nr:DUF3747 domain-containing protein [Cyanobacterium aponinum]AFZ53838.1 hypothetical protein Cyan10605_1735 [Cyanobacterium aponinum PCC 10605]MTF39779.1 DUF3747 domain-containing protein [Cyanobacterium aponinum 0216]WPF89479.1 DUF3747 domain-containing protein [Cyanobacterium aponinum AL20115]WRL41240.1 DUF3747 domain-containing protein [Cyanobacterium aponinum UTEX 3222]